MIEGLHPNLQRPNLGHPIGSPPGRHESSIKRSRQPCDNVLPAHSYGMVGGTEAIRSVLQQLVLHLSAGKVL